MKCPIQGFHMIFLTLNWKGLANPFKKLVIKGLVYIIKPYVIFLLEIMSYGEIITQELSKLLSDPIL